MARRRDPWYLDRYPVTILGSSGVPHWVFCIEVLRIESARRAYAVLHADGFTSPTDDVRNTQEIVPRHSSEPEVAYLHFHWRA